MHLYNPNTHDNAIAKVAENLKFLLFDSKTILYALDETIESVDENKREFDPWFWSLYFSFDLLFSDTLSLELDWSTSESVRHQFMSYYIKYFLKKIDIIGKGSFNQLYKVNLASRDNLDNIFGIRTSYIAQDYDNLKKEQKHIIRAVNAGQHPYVYYINVIKNDSSEGKLNLVCDLYEGNLAQLFMMFKTPVQDKIFQNEVQDQLLDQLSDLFRKYVYLNNSTSKKTLYLNTDTKSSNIVYKFDDKNIDVKLTDFDDKFILEINYENICQNIPIDTQKENDAEIIHFLLLNNEFKLPLQRNFLNSKITKLRTNYHVKENLLRLYKIFCCIQAINNDDRSKADVFIMATDFLKLICPENCDNDNKIRTIINDEQINRTTNLELCEQNALKKKEKKGFFNYYFNF